MRNVCVKNYELKLDESFVTDADALDIPYFFDAWKTAKLFINLEMFWNFLVDKFIIRNDST